MKLFFNKVLIAVFKFSTLKLVLILEKKNELSLKNEISTELLTSKSEQKKIYYILESPFQMAYILPKYSTFFCGFWLKTQQLSCSYEKNERKKKLLKRNCNFRYLGRFCVCSQLSQLNYEYVRFLLET